jgi:hypothetical protein
MITGVLAGWSTVARAMDRAPTLATALRRTRVTAAASSRKSATEIAAAALGGASANDDGEDQSDRAKHAESDVQESACSTC